jgi:hypothetical protein
VPLKIPRLEEDDNMTVKVSSNLHRELKQIEESGEVDMHDLQAVREYAEKHGLNVASRAVIGNRRRYLMCIDEGMEECVE